MEWGGCEQHLCLLAVGLKGQAQRKNMLSPIPKIFRCQEGKGRGSRETCFHMDMAASAHR